VCQPFPIFLPIVCLVSRIIGFFLFSFVFQLEIENYHGYLLLCTLPSFFLSKQSGRVLIATFLRFHERFFSLCPKHSKSPADVNYRSVPWVKLLKKFVNNLLKYMFLATGIVMVLLHLQPDKNVMMNS
jgi:hypothetical protein